MPRMFARMDMTAQGVDYARGEVVPMDKLPPALAKKLIDQRRVVPDKIAVRTADKEG